ncbi:hypothetical protein B484DRAFT_405295 [Ochromonadaceae sp. CCMP2298]|nr:hypothetical protein B484DRAFT_405295 [Ochromonadaceae sp. CCMP2298]
MLQCWIFALVLYGLRREGAFRPTATTTRLLSLGQSQSALTPVEGGPFAELRAESVRGRGRPSSMRLRSVSDRDSDRGGDQLLNYLTKAEEGSVAVGPKGTKPKVVSSPEAKALRKSKDASSRKTAVIPESATCKKCGEMKAAADFYKRRNGNLLGQCTECRSDQQRQWGLSNPEKVKENSKKYHGLARTDPAKKLKEIIREARRRKIAVPSDKEMKYGMEDEMLAILNDPCHYSGHKPKKGGVLNGIDRVDSSIGYDVLSNLVPCSGKYNKLKGPLNYFKFFALVRAIVENRELDISAVTVTVDDGDCEGEGEDEDEDEGDVNKKKIPNDLTLVQKLDLLFSPCKFTGRSPAWGIDRINSNIHYTLENSVACSTECNLMKNNLTDEKFERQICDVADYTAYWVMPDVSHMPITFFGKTQQPVAVRMDNGTEVIFPSIGRAAYVASIMGGGLNWNEKLIQRDLSGGGGRWRYATAHEYKSQHLIFQGQEHHEQAVVVSMDDGTKVIFRSMKHAARTATILGGSLRWTMKIIQRELSEGGGRWRIAAAGEVPTQHLFEGQQHQALVLICLQTFARG